MKRATYKCLDDLKDDGIHPSALQDLDQMERIVKMVHGKKDLKNISVQELTSSLN